MGGAIAKKLKGLRKQIYNYTAPTYDLDSYPDYRWAIHKLEPIIVRLSEVYPGK